MRMTPKTQMMADHFGFTATDLELNRQGILSDAQRERLVDSGVPSRFFGARVGLVLGLALGYREATAPSPGLAITAGLIAAVASFVFAVVAIATVQWLFSQNAIRRAKILTVTGPASFRSLRNGRCVVRVGTGRRMKVCSAASEQPRLFDDVPLATLYYLRGFELNLLQSIEPAVAVSGDTGANHAAH